jgi:DNA-binding transcriptional LysR family regulator
MDSLHVFNVFVRVAETRSFTAAGRRLGLSASAVGKAVGRLEDRLSCRLFHRNTRCMALSPEGHLLLDSCRRIFAEIKTVEMLFARNCAAPSGRLRVNLPLIGMIMLPTLHGFMRAYPKIALDMDFSDHAADVVEGGYDAVVVTGEVKDSRLMTRVLGVYHLEVVGSPDYFVRRGMPMLPADLMEHNCLHQKHPATGKPWRWPFARAMMGDDIVLPVTAASNSVEPLVSMAERGIGIACVPDFAVKRQVAEGTLVSVLGQYVEHEAVLRAVWPSGRMASPKLKAFVDFLAQHLLPSELETISESVVSMAGGYREIHDATAICED